MLKITKSKLIKAEFTTLDSKDTLIREDPAGVKRSKMKIN